MIATKVHGRMRPGPNGAGLSRVAILREIDECLRRLGVDHVDLYQIHRWDPDVPDRGDDGGAARRRAGRQGALPRGVVDVGLAVRQGPARGRARTAGRRSSRCRTTTTCSTARRSGRCCRSAPTRASACCPWSPLARGRLTRDWDAETGRSRDRRVRLDPLPRRGPRDRRHRGPGGRATWRAAGAGRAGVAAAPARRHLADRRRHQARTTSPTPSPPSTWSSPTTSSTSSGRATSRTPIAGHR